MPSDAAPEDSPDTTAPTVFISDVSYRDGRVTTTGTVGYPIGDPASVAVVICSQNSWPCTSTDYSGTACTTPGPR